ncbi:MAG: DUF2029 domain-containing protein [Ignavibacteriae bacterium]|nr:DUF2029 domain-containing protein [Ignavibacteriota bacterium]
MKITQYVLLAVLGIFIVWKGVIPALTKIDTDFPTYYTSARLLMDGEDIAKMYDDKWFNEQVQRYGINHLGRFTPFPPIAAFIMLPIAYLPPLQALQAWTVINLAALSVMILLLSKILQRDIAWCSLLALGSGLALINNIRFGQFYLILSLLIIVSYYWWQKNRYIASGTMLGIGAALKYFPALYLPLFIIQREWKIIVMVCTTILVLTFLSLLVFGIEVHQQFLTSVLGGHLSGEMHDPFLSIYQSWNSLLRRLFVYDSALNAHPLLQSPTMFYVSKYCILVSIAIPTIIGLMKAQRAFGNKAPVVQFALLNVAGLLALPSSATYHFLLLILPIGILLSLHEKDLTIEQKILIVCYAAIGFMPYRFFRPFDGQGILTVLAYPRLWLMTAIFITTLVFIWRNCVPRQSVVELGSVSASAGF